MRINLKKRFTALMLAGMMVTSNVLPAYSATDGIAVEQADASYEGQAADSEASADGENSEAGGASSEQDDTGKPVADVVDSGSTTDASANAGDESQVAGAAAGSDSSTSASDNAGAGSDVAGEQTTANKSEATSGTATEETKSDAANGTATEETKSDAANGTATEESKSDAANGTTTEESKSDAANGTVTEESKADAVHGSNAGGSSVVGAGSVGIGESTGAAVEIEETKPTELLEEETKLATESEIPKEEDEKKLEEKENRKTIYIAFGKGVKVTATLEDANAVPDDARLRVTDIEDGELYDAYIAAMDEAEPEIKHTKDNTDIRDIAFIMKDEDGEETEYEPTEGSVKIAIEYLGNNLKKRLGVDDIAEVKTYHLPLAEGVKAEGEKTIDVQNVKASDVNVQELDSDVKTEKKVEVEVDSFSAVVMARRSAAKAAAYTTDSEPIDLKRITSGITVSTRGEISRDAAFTLNMDFDVDNGRLGDTVKTENESGESVIHNVWEYDLSEFVKNQPMNIVNGSGNLVEGNEIRGSYKVENNKITFTVDPRFLNTKTSGVKGSFNFEAQLNKDMIGTEEEYTFTFPGSATGVTISFPKKVIEVSKYCDKGSGDVTLETNADGSITLNYTLVFKVNAAVQNLTLEDTLSGPQNYIESSFVFSENGWPTYQYSDLKDAITFVDPDKKSIKLDVWKVLGKENTKADGRYVLSYSTIVNAEDIGNELKNHAQWTWDGDQTTDGGTTSITPHKKLQVRKSVENKNGEYHYTITVGGEGVNMRGHKITDTMSDNQVLDGDITISPKVNGKTTITPVADDHNYSQNDTKLFEYTFPNDQDCIGTYTITYKTKPAKPAKPDQLTGTQDIKNRVTDEHNGDRGEASSENQKHNFGVQQMARITKSWAGFNTDAKAVLWNIKVELPEGCTELHNVIVTELMAGCGENQGDRPYSMTFDLSHVVIKKTDGTPYEGSHSIIGDGKSIKFENLTSSIVIEGVRTVCSDDHNYTNTEKASFYNKAGVTVDGKPGQDSWAEKTFADWSMSKYVTEDKATGEFIWTVTVNPEKANLREEKDIIFEDEIPQGMKLVDGLKITTDGWSSNGKRYDSSWVWPEIAVSNITGKIHVNITSQLDGTKVNNRGTIYNIPTPTGISGVKYTISYKTKLTDEALQKERNDPHKVYSYKNVARVVDQGGNKIKGDAATVKHQYKYFTKTDTSPETLTADIIEYQIVINPDALTLNGGNDLTLTDTLPEGTQFISNGYNFNPEGSCKTLGLDSGTRKLKVVVPDRQSITFTYKLKSDNLYPDWSGHVFTNYAELSGTGKQVINVEKKHIIRKHSGNITGSTSSIHIHKYDQDDMASSLYGAEFKLYRLKVEADGTLTQDGGAAVATETTDNDGNLTFENLTPVNNNSTAAPYYAYKFVETKAPDGYEINEAYNAEHGHYFIFYTDAATKANDVKAQIEAKNTDIKVEVVSGAHTFEVSNKSVPETGSLKFTKSFSGVTKDQLKDLTFTVKNVTDRSNPKTIGTYKLADIALKSGETTVYEKTLTVEPGEYEVTESSTEVTGYTLNTTTSVTSGSVSIAKDESKVIDLKNEYTKDECSLKFTKSFSGVTKDQLKDLTFTVKNVTDRSDPKTIGTYKLADIALKSGETTVYEKTLTVEPGEYEVTESSTGVTGYTLNTTTSVTSGKVSIAKDEHKVINLKNEYSKDQCSLKFTKSFSGVTKDQLKDLTFTVKNVTDSSNPKTIGTYKLSDMTLKSGETTVYEKTLTVDPGEYEVTESNTGVTGYTLKTTTSVTRGSVSIAKDDSKVINLKNDYDVDKHPVVISKTNAGASELEGAVLKLTDATGALVDQWTSTTTARTFELKPGTYKFCEVSAPSGYLVADDITFTVTIDGTITVDGKTVDKVVMIDRKKPETTVPETTPAETTTPSGGGGGGGDHPHPLPETTPAETTPAETTVPETTPVETTTPGGGNGGPSEEVETDEFGRVRGANRGKNKNGQDGGNVKGANRGKTRTGDESMMSIFGFGFLAAVLVLLGWFGIRFTKRNRR